MSEERNSNDVEDKISIKEIHETFGVVEILNYPIYGKDQYFFQLS